MKSLIKHTFIKYEKLSKEIKEEIEHYKTAKLKEKIEIPNENAMIEWFDRCFDAWMIKRFSKGKGKDKRKHHRLDVELPIKIISTLIESSADDKDAKEYIGRVINISRGGLYFKYHKAIEISSIIKVVLDFSEIDSELESVEALAMVVRLEDLDDAMFGIGVVFSSIYETNKDSLDIFILKSLSYHIYSK